jgi:hypothetical protein
MPPPIFPNSMYLSSVPTFLDLDSDSNSPQSSNTAPLYPPPRYWVSEVGTDPLPVNMKTLSRHEELFVETNMSVIFCNLRRFFAEKCHFFVFLSVLLHCYYIKNRKEIKNIIFLQKNYIYSSGDKP